MTTLTICISMFLSVCSQVRTYEFPTLEACRAEQAIQLKNAHVTYAICGKPVEPRG